MANAVIAYPDARRADLVERHFGRDVADPYRWLENDARSDAEVMQWVQAQNQLTHAYLEGLAGREVFVERLTALYNHERVTAPQKRGGRYFYLRNSGLEKQSSLCVRDTLHGAQQVLIDPGTWSDDGSVALAQWAVNATGSHVAYAVQESGSDWHTLRVMDVCTGRVLPDEVKWSRFSVLSWARDGAGFFYSRYPALQQGETSQEALAGHAVYFHALGTPAQQDRLVYGSPDQPNLINVADCSEDGRYALVSSTPGTMSNAVTVVDLGDPAWPSRRLIDNFDHQWTFIGNQGSTLFFLTSDGAPRARIVTLDLDRRDADGKGAALTEIVPEQDDVLRTAWLIGGRLLAAFMVDARTVIRRYELDGRPDGQVQLPGIGSAGGFAGRQDETECFFGFTSFNAPTTLYHYDVGTRVVDVWARPKIEFDFEAITVDQQFCRSRDGTRVPMFIIKRRDVHGPAPTLLYGYGGFAISMIPAYSPDLLAWVEQGGVAVVANIRGGGEYGQDWHYAGRLANKQNVFDDFIAAASYLKAQGVTPEAGLAIQGESNGGLLVGAVVNQRPDLFAAALPGVGVMDMLRFDKFTAGHLWAPEFGSPGEQASFDHLLAYSPYHNVKSGASYPAILASTADTDDRVVPAHTFKYTAALQAADLGDRPRLVRIETRAGHGAGKPTQQVIESTADLWAFAAHWTGLTVPRTP